MTAFIRSESSSTLNTPNIDRPVRAWASRTPKWQRFHPVRITRTETAMSVESKQKGLYAYQRQYSHVYHHRLTALRDRCWQQLMEATTMMVTTNDRCDYNTVNRVLELKEEEPSRIVGTLVKECTNPKELSLHPKSICRASDQLYLEDESGRVVLSLIGKDEYQEYYFCTGVVVGIEGTVDDKGVMHVHRIVPPMPMIPPNLCNNSHMTIAVGGVSQPEGHDPHVLLLSSLECGDPQVSSIPREMLVNYLQGNFSDTASKVARIIVAGSGPSATDPLGGVTEFDFFVGLQIACNSQQQGNMKGGLQIPVDVLPSSKDPTTANWPQRPLHSSLMPLASMEDTQSNVENKRRKMVMMTPNPYEAIHGAQILLGTDGLNVRDLRKNILKKNVSNGRDVKTEMPELLTELEALEQTLTWAHLCPTGPDSLGMVPWSDPMVIEKTTPHIYFCGNCEQGFATKVVSNDKGKTRLVCIPKFSQTGEGVLVNLVSLDVELLCFRTEESIMQEEVHR